MSRTARPFRPFAESARRAATRKDAVVDWKIEVVVIPVTDIE
jgi:hypothetical protein